jgi:predicted nucleic acid-binding protein
VTSGERAPFTIDASVYLSAVQIGEAGHRVSAEFLAAVRDCLCPVIVPALLLPEVAGVLARSGIDAAAARGYVSQLTQPRSVSLVALDAAEAERAANVAAEQRLRGADAVYAAVALRYGSTLVSLDQQQLDRAAAVVPALTPAEALAKLAE